MILEVRKLAALDMALHGPRFIVIEFALGVGGCALIGGLSLWAGLGLLSRGVTWQLALGAALLWIALNYLPLLLHAIDLARRGTARQEAALELAHPDLVRRWALAALDPRPIGHRRVRGDAAPNVGPGPMSFRAAAV